MKFGEVWLRQIRMLFNLKADTDEAGTVESIRNNVDFRSANAWTLVFAIFVASVGLNINSVAVIIGAMLISPLMGPIVGAGLALGTFDFELLKRSLRNLSFAVGISVLTSAIYFFITPLSDVQSELLARTNPTFFDVLIAFFGGAAGIVAISRKEKGNAIPGVAIATALMPPLCTAGFGLANGEWAYFFGAMYLFVINSVFICMSTYLFVRYLGFAKVTYSDPSKQVALDKWLAGIATIVIVPSLVFAWFLQREMAFRSKANRFIDQEMKYERSFVVNREISFRFKDPKFTVGLLGESLPDSEIEILNEKLKRYGLPEKSLEIKETSMEQNLEKRLSERFSTESKALQDLKVELSQKELELGEYRAKDELSIKVSGELSPLFPSIGEVYLPNRSVDKTMEVLVYWKEAPSKTDRDRASLFLEKRLDLVKDKAQVLHLKAL